LRYVKRPLPKVKALTAEIEKGKAANVTNNKALAEKKAELKELNNIHTFLFYLDKAYQPPPPQKQQERTQQQARKRSHDFDR